ncbi:LPS translocon maturation chaperone LptM [Vulcaniibacterium tengchongense]|uniref:Lipoprotein n=1 Tax=Vulcaniibacterium tengchongense TaxID=1273429 RepID=A0A3N4VE84_9GAMM|nr:lipoprotein [Vulcaniibacterium tengchongense]RPE79805.1 hypothetical protein EDC50_1631 [Vulcaniibacterium tengchongense]
MNARHLLCLIALPLALAACGNKGPLFLPPKELPVDPAVLPPPGEPATDGAPADAGSAPETAPPAQEATDAPPAEDEGDAEPVPPAGARS